MKKLTLPLLFAALLGLAACNNRTPQAPVVNNSGSTGETSPETSTQSNTTTAPGTSATGESRSQEGAYGTMDTATTTNTMTDTDTNTDAYP